MIAARKPTLPFQGAKFRKGLFQSRFVCLYFQGRKARRVEQITVFAETKQLRVTRGLFAARIFAAQLSRLHFRFGAEQIGKCGFPDTGRTREHRGFSRKKTAQFLDAAAVFGADRKDGISRRFVASAIVREFSAVQVFFGKQNCRRNAL